jgi:cellulose biosynthesis protein BcsQ
VKKLHFIGGEKGGVGKSVTCRLLTQYAIDHQKPVTIYDADLSHGAMIRYYHDFSHPLDFNDPSQADSMIEKMLEADEDVIIDLAAQTSKNLNQWMDETGLPELSRELGIQLYFWHVMDDGSDSLNLLQQLLNHFDDIPHYIIVKNLARGSDFSLLQKQLDQYQDQYNFSVINLPALNSAVMRKIDHISASFWSAANNSDKSLGPVLGLLERQRVKVWLNKAYQEINRLGI